MINKKVLCSFVLYVSFFLKIEASNYSKDKMVKLIPGTEEYEKFMNKKDLAETKFSQRSWLMSAIIPTAGQIYNKRYLRASLYWIGFAGLIGGALYCQNFYAKHLHEKRDAAMVRSYAKIRDGFLIGTLLLYVINIIDAYVIAQLTTFDISDNVSVKVVPKSSANSIGMEVNLDFGE